MADINKLREKAQRDSTGGKLWEKALSPTEVDSLEELWEGHKADEYSLASAYRVWIEFRPEPKVSRSAFISGCRRVFE